MSGRKVVHLVPHTHWDREWYRPFQSFRMALVELIDGVLDELEADGRFAFTLDGQLATVDDYLEIRPHAEDRIRRQIAAGRLAIGPWQILMDEFLVSGETMVRNLERGWHRAEELGRPMHVGYLPDMFGHVAQMPQILSRAGLRHAVVWRGIPAAIGHHAFRWSAPDGSSVRAEYLIGGYGNGVSLLVIPERLEAKLEIFDEAMRPFFGSDELLAMYGTDHFSPLPGLVDLVGRLNAAQDRYEVRIATLADYIAGRDGASDGAELPSWQGELRSGARANVLMGVTSTRIHIKAACARAERALLRYAEPLQALYASSWPEEYLALAWGKVIDNSAHDSICACSVDPVAEQVAVRFAEAEQIAAGLTERAARQLARSVPRGSTAVINPSPVPRVGLVEVDVAVPESWEHVALALPDGAEVGTQEVGERQERLLFAASYRGLELRDELFRRMHGRELFGRWFNSWHVEPHGGIRRVTVEVDSEAHPEFLDVDEIRRELAVAVQGAPDATWELEIVARPRRRLVAAVPAPPLGFAAVRPVIGEGAIPHAVTARADGMENGLVHLTVAADGTFGLAAGEVSVEGVGRLVEGGDFGDSYNYGPPARDRLVEVPDKVVIEQTETGPVRGLITVLRWYRWPAGLLADGSERTEETLPVRVATALELRAGEPFVRVSVSFDNPSDDHRVRFHVPIPRPAQLSAAEGQFAVVERGPDPEGGYGEVPLATFPASGFADAGGMAILLEHVTEYELLDDRELALTVLRATGLISRNLNPYRADPAGPEIAIPDAQCRGPVRLSFALFPHAGAWHEADVVAQMERYRHPFLTSPGTRAGHRTDGGDGPVPTSPLLELRGEGVELSSLRRRHEWLEARLVCLRPTGTTASLLGSFREAREADLLGRPLRDAIPAPGRLDAALAAWEIRTVQLR